MNSDLQDKTPTIRSSKGNILVENPFKNKVAEFSRNPLGIISLFLVLVYVMAGIVAGTSVLDSYQRQIIIWFLVLFPVLVLLAFYLLVTKHYSKLYAPSDFSDETNFMRTFERGIENSPKIKSLENLTAYIRKEIEEQPLYRYTKLSEAGKRIVLRAERKETFDLTTFLKEEFQLKELESQARILVDYGWINIEGTTIKITNKGKDELATFVDLCYARAK